MPSKLKGLLIGGCTILFTNSISVYIEYGDGDKLNILPYMIRHNQYIKGYWKMPKDIKLNGKLLHVSFIHDVYKHYNFDKTILTWVSDRPKLISDENIDEEVSPHKYNNHVCSRKVLNIHIFDPMYIRYSTYII